MKVKVYRIPDDKVSGKGIIEAKLNSTTTNDPKPSTELNEPLTKKQMLDIYLEEFAAQMEEQHSSLKDMIDLQELEKANLKRARGSLCTRLKRLLHKKRGAKGSS